MKEWWNEATEDERIAQVKGGHELGLSQKQIAMNLKTDQWTIQRFCKLHGLDFSENAQAERFRKSRESWKLEETMAVEKFKQIDNSRVDFAFTLFENNRTSWSMNYLDEV